MLNISKPINNKLSPLELKSLCEIHTWRSAFALFIDWLLILTAWSAAIYIPHPLVYFLSFLLVARQQLALAIVMHDAAHRRLSSSIHVNDLVGQYLCAAPLFFSLFSYQRLHLKHHQNPLADDDPDLTLIGGYPISRWSFLRKIGRDICGLSYFKFLRYFLYLQRQNIVNAKTSPTSSPSSGSATPTMSKGHVVASILIMNALILSVFIFALQPWHYLFFWALPAMTILQVLLRVRGVAEHAGYAPNPDQSLNARTVINFWQTLIFAPHNVNYHIEHHLYPAVPYYRLPQLHRTLKVQNALPPNNLYPGYGSILRELIK